MRAVLVAVAVVLMCGSAARAQDGPVVVELFTSQGCSSCPPADAFLTELARERPDVLPLAFHVTYWNYLGWKDPYSLDAATARQRAYAVTLHEDGVYTPQMVVDGVRGFVGSDRAAGLAAIAGARVTLGLSRGGDLLVVTAGAGVGEGQLLLVGFDRSHRTPIGRGENGGRTLEESNIVRSLTSVGHWSGGALTLHQTVPAGEAFAVLLQAADGRIIGAARMAGPAS
jgi:hypothetical protein